MDLNKIIGELREERRRLETVITVLESLENASISIEGLQAFHKHRGRRLMSVEERRTVSERMKKYWASRHQSQA